MFTALLLLAIVQSYYRQLAGLGRSVPPSLQVVYKLCATDKSALVRKADLLSGYHSKCRLAGQGVDFLHANGIVHGDIKPDNLLLGADGHVRLVDLGSARRVASPPGDILQRTAGTPAFFSPEMAAGLQFSGRAADLWAVAVCLFYFVAGAFPKTVKLAHREMG